MNQNTAKYIILYAFLLLIALPGYAQFWTEDFIQTNTQPNNIADGYTGVNGTWTVTNLPGNSLDLPNIFYVSCTEAGMVAGSCGTTCSGGPFPPPSPLIGQSLHIGSNAGSLGDVGAAYDSGDGNLGFYDSSTEIRAESPTIDCSGQTSISLVFSYIEFGDGITDNAEVWYSADNGVTFALLADMAKTDCGNGSGLSCASVPCTGFEQGQWTAFSIPLPANADNNPGVKIAFRWVNNNDGVGTNPSFAVTRIQLSGGASTNTITAGPVLGSTFCEGATIDIPFTSAGVFGSTNIYTAQLSDATGAFILPIDIGTLTSAANTGTISATIPLGTLPGTGYLIQVISSSPVVTSTAIGPFTIEAAPVLSATISTTSPTTICPGDCVDFTSVVTNGGSNPTYQWQINGVNAPGTSNTSIFQYCNFVNNDQVTLVVNSTLACVSGSPYTSTPIVINLTTPASLTATLTGVPPSLTVCSGSSVSLTVTPDAAAAGPTPTFAWTINGTALPGITTQTINYNGVPLPLVDGTIVCAITTSSLTGCITNNPFTICDTITVVTAPTPSVTVTPSVTTVCAGSPVTFTAAVTNGGTTPTFQWLANGNPITGETQSTYNADSVGIGDIITVEVTSSDSCATTPVLSAPITITVLPLITPTIGIATTTGVCPNQNIIFVSTATGAGDSPIYTWQLNGNALPENVSIKTIPASALSDGDIVTCVLESNYACTTTSTAVSNNYVVDVLPPATIDLVDEASILYGETYQIEAKVNGPLTSGLLLWTPDSTLTCNTCPNPKANPIFTTEYVLQYTNSSGCRARDTIKVEVKPNYETFIPSAFSPNGDNVNDVFYVRGPFVASVEMKIWDRYGGLIFESQYIAYGWDGNNKFFKEVNSGVYVYFITVYFLDGTIKEFKGNVTLAR